MTNNQPPPRERRFIPANTSTTLESRIKRPRYVRNRHGDVWRIVPGAVRIGAYESVGAFIATTYRDSSGTRTVTIPITHNDLRKLAGVLGVYLAREAQDA